MPKESHIPYEERTATVVGYGPMGRKMKKVYQGIGFKEVKVCEKNDPFVDYVNGSDDLFFAVDNESIIGMLKAANDFLQPRHSIIDGSSVKTPLIPTYKELDAKNISVASTHVGSVPNFSWRGIKVWVCNVGPNSQRAQRLATDLYFSTNSSIRTIDIENHANVEKDQWVTMVTAHIVAGTLRNMGMTLREFTEFATLNSELLGHPVARTLGQGTNIPTEIVMNQPRKRDFARHFQAAFNEFESALYNKERMQTLMDKNIKFHNNPDGLIPDEFRKAGKIGARNANLRMHSLSFRLMDDVPGKLIALLEPFYEEGNNLTAVDSIPGTATPEELEQGVDPDKIVDFDIGIDPKTTSVEKETRIREKLMSMGCQIL